MEPVPCDPIEHLTYHVHAHLNIRFDGQLEPIPANVGNAGTCLFWLHTHSGEGVIHVEAPRPRVFTLGQFFDVWSQPLDEDEVAFRSVEPGEGLYVFVDGQPYEGDPRAIELTDLRAIELQIGAEPLDPLPYTFSPEFR